MKITFEVPALVRARREGSGRKLKYVVTSVKVTHDVPEVSQGEAELAYAVGYPNKRDGFDHIIQHDGSFYACTGVWDGDASREGWPEWPWSADTPLMLRFWRTIADGLLEMQTEDQLLDIVRMALEPAQGDQCGERMPGWEAFFVLESEADLVKATTETEEDIESFKAVAADILNDLIIFRRSIHIVTGQPCYKVSITKGEARIAHGTTQPNDILRQVRFGRPAFFPYPRWYSHLAATDHYFPIEEREEMLEFIAGCGARIVGAIPRASRLQWAINDSSIHAVEIDRVARLLVHRVGVAFNDAIPLLGSNILAQEDRKFFNAVYDLKELLDQSLDPNDISDEIEARATALLDIARRPRPYMPQGRPLLADHIFEFFDQAMSRAEARPIHIGGIHSAPGSLPSQE